MHSDFSGEPSTTRLHLVQNDTLKHERFMLVKLYEKNNNPKDLARIVEVLEESGIIIYPTDTMYAIGCHALKERAIERICRFKGIDPR